MGVARLVLNGGSSSWKCGVYDVAADAKANGDADTMAPLAEVDINWSVGAGDSAVIETTTPSGTHRSSRPLAREKAVSTALFALERALGAGFDMRSIESVGHRIVHGADEFTRTSWLDAAAVERLKALEPFAPAHNPAEIAAVETIAKELPNVPQYAVFDTQFHRTLAPAAYTYPGPYGWLEKKIRRYGFHGSSVAYATERAASLLTRDRADLQLIVAHLGGGCSVTAVRNGASVDTSMGFTPLDGTMMGTRSGSIDPAIAIFLMREASPTATLATFANGLERTLNRESGLAGISGISGDLREIEAASANGDARATLAIDLFVHRLAATIGGLLPSLDRLDALVFTGGIGEHASAVRARTCARLAYTGIALDAKRNESATGTSGDGSDSIISSPENPVMTLVITAREDWYIAREGARLRLASPS